MGCGVEAAPLKTKSYDCRASIPTLPASSNLAICVGTSETIKARPSLLLSRIARMVVAAKAAASNCRAPPTLGSISNGLAWYHDLTKTIIPAMRCAGIETTQRLFVPKRLPNARADAANADSLRSTPRGIPVDPEVAQTNAMSSDSSGNLGSSGLSALRVWAVRCADPAAIGAIAEPVPSRAGPITAASFSTPPMPAGTVTAVNFLGIGFSLNVSDWVIETSLERRTITHYFLKVCHGYSLKVRTATSCCR